MKRRTFLKGAGLLAGGTLIGDSGVFGGNRKSVIKVGIIGCGDRGRGMMHVIRELKDQFSITAICDTLDFRLESARKMLGTGTFRAYKDYRKLLDDSNVDAVVIAVPLYLHYPVAADSLQAGKHLYLEKTMTFDIPQALKLVKLSEQRRGQVLQVGHQYRYSPLYYKVKEFIDKGWLGKVNQVDCRWDRNGNWRRPVPDPSLERRINWRMYKAYSGGLVAELLSHQIDFINWIFDAHPTAIQATGGIDIFKDGRETFDNVQVMFRYPEEGIIGNFGATCGNAHDGYLFKIKGTKGTISLLTDRGVFLPEKNTAPENELIDGVTGASKIVWSKEGGAPILPEPTKDGTWYALIDFYKAVRSGRLPDSNVYTGAKTAICVDLANQALYGQKVMHWSKEANAVLAAPVNQQK
ncbi:Gfo/Idh/MocA family protein [Niabella aurantiaca]|uniref:Gfo/Idh/MocA family protein n=1 Tax=Niabella aurantiaca TaxID=379900 RepID=UPI0003A1E4D9|nr:Gfo/Idh/MocA family oxidoreductase [Niabella aurantiaca]